MRHTKKTRKKERSFCSLLDPFVFFGGWTLLHSKKRLLQKIEREKTTNAQRERERERYKEDAI